MNQPEYLLVFLSLLFGLGLAEIMQSLHRLAGHDARVAWHWLPLAWVLLVFLLIMQLWWSYYETINAPAWSNLFLFLIPAGVLVLVYLISAAVLPDPERGRSVKMLDWYFERRRWFFALGALLFPLLILQNVVVQGGFVWGVNQAMRIAATLIMMSLAWSRSRNFHSIMTIGALALLLSFIVMHTLRLERGSPVP